MTCCGSIARSPVIGFWPSFASVAPITARSRHVDEHRALAEVGVDDLLDVGFEHAEAAHEPRQRTVAVAGLALRREHAVVDRQAAARVAAEGLDDALELVAGIGPPSSAVVTIAPAFTMGLNGRPVRGSTVTELNGLPDGSTPTWLEHDVLAPCFERHTEHERLRDRLDRERRRRRRRRRTPRRRRSLRRCRTSADRTGPSSGMYVATVPDESRRELAVNPLEDLDQRG